MKNFLAILFSSIFLCSSLYSQSWRDPNWDDLIAKSELVGRFEVVEALNLQLAKVSPIKLLKGTMPEGKETIVITGYNDPGYSAEDMEAASLKKGDQVYLCLWKWEDEIEVEFYFYAPSPSCGTFRISDDLTAFSARSTSYPWEQAKQPTASLEELITAIVRRQSKLEIDPRVVAANLMAMRAEAQQPAETSHLAEFLARLRLMGQGEFLSVFEAISSSPIADARIELAKLLGLSAKSDASRKLLQVLINDKDPVVQGEAVRQLAKIADKEIAALFTEKLVATESVEIAPDADITAEQHARLGSRLTMIQTLSQLKYQPAASSLATILKNVRNAREVYFIADALQKIDSADLMLEPMANHLINNTNSSVCGAIADLAIQLKMTQLEPAFNTYVAKHGETADELAIGVEALGAFGDPKSGETIQKRLSELLANGIYDQNTHDMAFSMVEALANLKHQPARNLVDDTLFLYYGIDPVLTSNPELTTLKRDTENAACKKAIIVLFDHPSPTVRATSFIMNRRANDPSNTKPEIVTVLHAKILQNGDENISQQAVETLKQELVQITKLPADKVSVTSWAGGEPMVAQGGDERAKAELSQFAFMAWLNYIEKTGPKDTEEFLSFLLKSGIAEKAKVSGKANSLLKEITSPKG